LSFEHNIGDVFFPFALAGSKGKITGRVTEKDRNNYEDICF